ncbi:MAG: hypothetical protein V3R83_08100 [Gammaproteobacteria bacterium]
MDTDKVNRWLTLTANLGILIGLVLLIVEIRQNSQLMRAQINMDRTASTIETLINVANGGAVATIQAKLFEEVDGFPMALGWSDELTPEEHQRYRFWVTARLFEFNNDWFQCTEGLVEPETCQREVRARMLRYLYRFYEFGIGFSRQPQSFINEMQEIARQAGLPEINDDGTWN